LNAVIRIELTAEATVENQLRSVFMVNFGDELYGKLHRICTVTEGEPGAAPDYLLVHDIRRRDLGTVITLIGRAMRRHKMMDKVRLIRLDLQPPAEDPAAA
jgi:hypothetical protein